MRQTFTPDRYRLSAPVKERIPLNRRAQAPDPSTRRRKDRNMNNRRIFIGLQHFAEGEGDGGASATAHRQV